jgi:DNA-binding transcriptional LysR family regulator
MEHIVYDQGRDKGNDKKFCNVLEKSMMQMAATFRDIEIFVSVYEERSFTAAAQREGATQSGVSQHIGKLEAQLGTKLFSRQKGRISASPAADLYYRKCIEVLRAHEVAQQAVGEFKRGLAGEISIGLMPTMTRCVLAPALATFIATNPNIKVRVVEGYSGVLTKQVLSGDLDFAIVPGFPGATGLRSRLFARTPELLVTRTGSHDLKSTSIRLASIGALKLVVPSEGNTRRKLIDAYLATNGTQLNHLLEFDSMFGTLAFVAQSEWAAILPAIMMSSATDPTEFDIKVIVKPTFFLDLILIEQSRRPTSESCTVFLELLRDHTNRINTVWSRALGENEIVDQKSTKRARAIRQTDLARKNI